VDEKRPTAKFAHIYTDSVVCVCVCVLACDLVQAAIDNARPDEGTVLYTYMCVYSFVFVCVCVLSVWCVCVLSVCVDLRSSLQAAIDNACPDERAAL